MSYYKKKNYGFNVLASCSTLIDSQLKINSKRKGQNGSGSTSSFIPFMGLYQDSRLESRPRDVTLFLGSSLLKVYDEHILVPAVTMCIPKQNMTIIGKISFLDGVNNHLAKSRHMGRHEGKLTLEPNHKANTWANYKVYTF